MARNWYVLYTKPRNEKKVAQRLSQLGHEMFCPLISTMRQWSDRKKKVQIPMFTSYVFAHLDGYERDSVLQDPGVLNFVSWLGKPATIHQREIDAILKISRDGQNIFIDNKVAKGDLIKIPNGPFQGHEGIIAANNDGRLSIHIRQLDCLVHFRL